MTLTEPRRSTVPDEPAAGRVGVAIIGLGGAVATTAVAGVELIRLQVAGADGLPLAHRTDLLPYEALVFGGWDTRADDLGKAAHEHGVLNPAHIDAANGALHRLTPWPAVVDPAYSRNVDGQHLVSGTLTERVELIRADLAAFRAQHELDTAIVVNLASTEAWPAGAAPALRAAAAFEEAIAADAPEITPAMLYAYAAITSGCPYVNFTPSMAAEVPALVQLAEQHGVPVAGKDGKTGQTLLKTVLAPAFAARALRVDGWYSTNLLGNRDGEVLDDPAALASKVATKASALESILGYEIEDHLVRIDYYRPRGDAKEAWDNVDLRGFLGFPMQLKINLLARDSVLAAPLVLELVRLLAEAKRRGESGVAEQLGCFFKAPCTRDGRAPEHAFPAQLQALQAWLDAAR